jgi:hypothetical protein
MNGGEKSFAPTGRGQGVGNIAGSAFTCFFKMKVCARAEYTASARRALYYVRRR